VSWFHGESDEVSGSPRILADRYSFPAGDRLGHR